MNSLISKVEMLAFMRKLSKPVTGYGRRYVGSVVPKLRIEGCPVKNEPILGYLKGSQEREELENALKRLASNCEEIPIVIGNEEIKSKRAKTQVMPHSHVEKIATFYWADSDIIKRAIICCVESQKQWDKTPFEERIKIFECAADLIAGKYRQEINAATMLGQSKTVFQAEIDSACELVDFFRMNAYFLKDLLKYQPISENAKITKNSIRYRGIDGFFAAICPFNFTAIAGNLTYTPVLMGNAALFKPSDTAVLSNWKIFQIMREAGIPPGVVNFVPSDGPIFGEAITASPHLAGINFTGSVPTFSTLWNLVGKNLKKFTNFPKMVGECGGKNFHFVHPSADVETVVAQTIRSAFEYCGQKCSACSRMYVPESLWSKICEGLAEKRDELLIADVRDFKAFTSAVIDEKAYTRIESYIKLAETNSDLKILGGGNYRKDFGYFIEPTIVLTTNPTNKIMREEIFGPVLTIFVYKDKEVGKALELVHSTTKFALTGAVFAQDEKFLVEALDELKMSCGNFYINDKSTGAVVGQQPFGGARMSGTNDKAGGPHYMLRFTSPQAIKETFVPLPDVSYPYMYQ